MDGMTGGDEAGVRSRSTQITAPVLIRTLITYFPFPTVSTIL